MGDADAVDRASGLLKEVVNNQTHTAKNIKKTVIS